MTRWMASLLWCTVIASASGQFAERKGLLMPVAVVLSGNTVDDAGNPLSDVWICHSGDYTEKSKTDANGRFEIRTRAPAVVFRKAGYQSKYRRLNAGGQRGLRIVLDGSAPYARECAGRPACLVLKGFMSSFCLPRVRGVEVGKQGNDIDYGARWFWAPPRRPAIGIRHGAGPLWGAGLPFDDDVWAAVEYSESTYRTRQDTLVIDSRGKTASGKRWRVLGQFGETASYRNVPEQDAALLDRVLDGMCVAPEPAMRR